MESAAFALTVIVGSVLIAAAVGKARALKDFSDTLVRIGIPAGLAKTVARAVIGVEAAVAVALALAPRELAGIAAAFVFASLAIVSVAVSRRGIPCNCFGRSTTPLGTGTGLRALVLLMLASVIAVIPPDSGARFTASLDPFLVTASFGGGLLLVWWTTWPAVRGLKERHTCGRFASTSTNIQELELH